MQASLGNRQLSKMLTVAEVAELLQVHSTTIRRWEKAGALRSYRIGPKGNLRFKSEDIGSFIECAGTLPAADADEICAAG